MKYYTLEDNLNPTIVRLKLDYSDMDKYIEYLISILE